MQTEGAGTPGAGGRRERRSSAGRGRGAVTAPKEAVHSGSFQNLEDGSSYMYSVGHLVHRQSGLLRLFFGLSQPRRKPVHEPLPGW